MAVGTHVEYISPVNPNYGVHGEIVHIRGDAIVVRRYWHGNHGQATLNGSIVLRLVKYEDGTPVPEPLTSQWTPLWKFRITAPAPPSSVGG